MRTSHIVGIIAVVLALAAAAAAVVLALQPREQPGLGAPPPGPSMSVSATPTPIPSGPGPSTPEPAPSDGRQPAAVAITYAAYANSSIEVDAFVSNVSEDGGTCTASAAPVGGSVAQSVSGESLAGPTSTTCATLLIPAGSLASGTYTITVAYSSTTSAGSSTATIEVAK